MFYRKVKKFCFVIGFFYLNSNKKLLMRCKKCKKVRIFLFDIFERSEMGIENFTFDYQTAPCSISKLK
jgi:phosphoribosylanthranilate isomerase